MMFFPRYLALFILLVSQVLFPHANAGNDLQDLLHFQHKIKEATSPPCAQCLSQSEDLSETTTIAYDARLKNRRIEISVVSMTRAKEIFKQLAANEDIPHAFLPDGCFARAHAGVLQMDDLGVTSAKAYIFGDLRLDGGKFGELRWQYHVAPVLMVKTREGNVPYIFDPSLFSEPVPVETWKKLILKHPKSKLATLSFSDRFSFHPDQIFAQRSFYNEEDLELARDINRNYRRTLDMMAYEDQEKQKEENKAIKNKGKNNKSKKGSS